MPEARSYPARKSRVIKAFCDAFTKYSQVALVDMMFIQTNQITKTRQTLRKHKSLMIVGKNSLARVAIAILTTDPDPEQPYYELQKQYEKQPHLTKLLPLLKGKMAFIFSEMNYVELKPIVESEIIKSPAKAGVISPSNVWLRCGPTHQDPGKIGEFQNLGIQVKAIKGSLEIVKDYLLCAKGDIVTETVSHMCRMLNIIPFEYAMTLRFVFKDGSVIPEEIINLNTEDVLNGFRNTVRDMTAVSLGANLPNSLSVPHMLSNVFKNMLSIGVVADYKFKELEEAMNAKANAPVEQEAKKDDAPAQEEEEEEEESEDMDMGGLFD